MDNLDLKRIDEFDLQPVYDNEKQPRLIVAITGQINNEDTMTTHTVLPLKRTGMFKELVDTIIYILKEHNAEILNDWQPNICAHKNNATEWQDYLMKHLLIPQVEFVYCHKIKSIELYYANGTTYQQVEIV